MKYLIRLKWINIIVLYPLDCILPFLFSDEFGLYFDMYQYYYYLLKNFFYISSKNVLFWISFLLITYF